MFGWLRRLFAGGPPPPREPGLLEMEAEARRRQKQAAALAAYTEGVTTGRCPKCREGSVHGNSTNWITWSGAPGGPGPPGGIGHDLVARCFRCDWTQAAFFDGADPPRSTRPAPWPGFLKGAARPEGVAPPVPLREYWFNDDPPPIVEPGTTQESLCTCTIDGTRVCLIPSGTTAGKLTASPAVRVAGQPVTEATLRVGDCVEIGAATFVVVRDPRALILRER